MDLFTMRAKGFGDSEREESVVKIVTDSTCNLSAEVLAAHDIRVAPITIQFGNETYQEGIDITRDLFYRKVEEMGIIPTTSQPTPAWFSRYYQELAAQGQQILVITITAQHSGTYQSAVLAKSMVPEADVEVFDSKSISLGTGWMILEACQMAEAGRDRTAILSRLGEIRAGAHLFITPATLKYLQMSGRVGKLQGAVASLLNVKPIITLVDGTLEAGENIRTRRKAVNRLMQLMEEAVGASDPVNLAVIHARAPQAAQELLAEAKAKLNVRAVLEGDLVCSLAVHGGPGVVGLFAYRI
jgi:DegV family protein with EDD domain